MPRAVDLAPSVQAEHRERDHEVCIGHLRFHAVHCCLHDVLHLRANPLRSRHGAGGPQSDPSVLVSHRAELRRLGNDDFGASLLGNSRGVPCSSLRADVGEDKAIYKQRPHALDEGVLVSSGEGHVVVGLLEFAEEAGALRRVVREQPSGDDARGGHVVEELLRSPPLLLTEPPV